MNGQQACPAPTTEANEAVNYMLARDTTLLRNLNIVASSVADLQVMQDSSDGAFCTRLDSIAFPSSNKKYYYRAGSYVIVTDARPPIDPVTGRRFIREGRRVLIVDGSGNPIDLLSSGLKVPSNLRATTAINGEVEVVWTNPSATITSYRLQRATDAGPFVVVGASLPGSATRATDSSSLSPNTYRYRLVGYQNSADSGYSNQAIVTIAALGAISRTSGLLFQDDFTRPDEPLLGATRNWERSVVSGGSDEQFQVVSNHVEFRTPGGDALPLAKHAGSTGPLLVQTDWVRVAGGRTGPMLAPTTSEQDVFVERDPYNGWELWTRIAGGYSRIRTSVTALADSARLTLLREPNRVRFWSGPTLVFDWVSGTMNDVPLRGGFYAINSTNWDNFVVCKGNQITFSNLPSGYKLRVNGIISAAATGGAVSVDMGAASWPLSQIEILDGGGVLVKTHAPSGGVWGGDVYSLGGSP
jgi:hypothetical protein